TRFGDRRRSTLSWCRKTRISTCNAARDRNTTATAHQINLQRSRIATMINRFAATHHPYWVCDRDRGSACPRHPHCSADPDFKVRCHGETKKVAQRFTGSTPERSSQCCASDPFNRHRRIRHHPPANIDSRSKG